MFDLEKSTVDWLGDLRQSGSFEESDLEELGSHLKDEIEKLLGRGLSEKEAFWVATSRVGNREELPDEYAKTNTQAVWRHRFLWMAVGILAYLTVSCLVGLFLFSAKLAAAPSDPSAEVWNWLGVIELIEPAVVIAAALGWVYLVVMKNRLGTATQRQRSWWDRAGITMVYAIPLVLLVFLTSLAGIATPLIDPDAPGPSYGLVGLALTLGGIFSGVFAVLLASIGFVLSRPRKSKLQASPG